MSQHEIVWTNLPVVSHQNSTPRDNLGKAELAWRKEGGLMPTGAKMVKGGQVCRASIDLNAAIFVPLKYCDILVQFEYCNICPTQILQCFSVI